jgi:hypothetical protein
LLRHCEIFLRPTERNTTKHGTRTSIQVGRQPAYTQVVVISFAIFAAIRRAIACEDFTLI